MNHAGNLFSHIAGMNQIEQLTQVSASCWRKTYFQELQLGNRCVAVTLQMRCVTATH